MPFAMGVSPPSDGEVVKGPDMVDLLDMLKCPYDELARTYYGQEGLMTEEDRKDLKHWSDWVADCVSFEFFAGRDRNEPINEDDPTRCNREYWNLFRETVTEPLPQTEPIKKTFRDRVTAGWRNFNRQTRHPISLHGAGDQPSRPWRASTCLPHPCTERYSLME